MSRIKVAIRCRPLNSPEKIFSKAVVCNTKRSQVEVKEKRGGNKSYTFDKVFGEKSTQMEVYQSMVYPLIDEVLAGYNCTIFAYGQTGTGKTFTMEGEKSSTIGQVGSNSSWQQDPLAGIIPRALNHLFDELYMIKDGEYSIWVNYVEIYNEQLIDLLSGAVNLMQMKIYEDPNHKGSHFIHGLEEVAITTKEEVYRILEKGSNSRHTAATKLNAHSSRSHTIFTITVHLKQATLTGDEEYIRTGKLNLVDLAGSENIGRSGAKDKHMREAGQINQSLLTLGRVIHALVEKAPHIPYRESKLTRLLQDSLGGRTKTSIITTISPSSNCVEETLSALDYSLRAKSIMNKPEVNQTVTKKTLINDYTVEIERLRRDLEAARLGASGSGIFIDSRNYETLQDDLRRRESTIGDMRERITYLSQEFNRMNMLFDISSSRLERTKDTLLATHNKLVDTKQELRLTREQREQQKLIARQRADTEQMLRQQSGQLLNVIEEVSEDLSRTHDRLDQFREQNQQQRGQSTRFEDRVTLHSDQIRRALVDMRENVLSQTAHVAQTERTSLTDQKQKLEDFVNSMSNSACDIQAKLATLKAGNTSKMGDLEERKDYVLAHTEETMAVTVAEHDALEKSLADVFEKMRDMCKMVLDNNDRFGEILEKQATETTKTLDLAFDDVSNCLDEQQRRVQAMFTEMAERHQKIDEMHRSNSAWLAEQQQSLNSYSATTRDHLNNSARTDAIQCVKGNTDESTRQIDATSELVRSGLSEVANGDGLLEHEATLKQKWVGHLKASTIAHVEDLQSDMNEFNASIEQLQVLADNLSHCQTTVIDFGQSSETAWNNQLTDVTSKLSELDASVTEDVVTIDEQIVEVNASVNDFINQLTGQQIATGATPRRKNISVPRRFPATANDSQIINEFELPSEFEVSAVEDLNASLFSPISQDSNSFHGGEEDKENLVWMLGKTI